jgi:hypothetical protein
MTGFLGRLVADQFNTGLGATVVVENKPGHLWNDDRRSLYDGIHAAEVRPNLGRNYT